MLTFHCTIQLKLRDVSVALRGCTQRRRDSCVVCGYVLWRCVVWLCRHHCPRCCWPICFNKIRYNCSPLKSACSICTWCIRNRGERSEWGESGYSWKVNYFFECLKASIADLFAMLSSSVRGSGGRGDGDSGDGFADPCQEFKEGFFGVSSGLPLV